jgi:DNA-binding transcriptional LysR family regulator
MPDDEAVVLDLNDFRYFVLIVESGGLSAASRNMNVPKSTVSYRLQQLETALGVRLINRTSRSQSVTDAGAVFYKHAAEMLERAELAESEVRQRLLEPSGIIKFTTAVATSLFALRPILPEFIRRHPKIQIVQHTSDDQVDIVGGSYDLAVRAHTGPMSDSTLVQRILAPAPWYLFASANYVAQRGIAAVPNDLRQHDLMTMLRPGHPTAFRLSHATAGQAVVAFEPRFSGNDLVMLKQATEDGLGVAALPGYVCREEERSGKLIRVLPEWTAGEASITAVIPFRHGLLPSVRTFVDYLVAEIPKLVTPPSSN